MRGHGESKWELIEKRKKINIRKEQKVDSRSRLRGQVQMKIAVALIEGMCRIFGWFLFCFKSLGVTHGMAEHQNGGFKCHGLIESKCIYTKMQNILGELHCKSSYHFHLAGNALLFPSLTQLPLRRACREKLVIFLLSSFESCYSMDLFVSLYKRWF